MTRNKSASLIKTALKIDEIIGRLRHPLALLLKSGKAFVKKLKEKEVHCPKSIIMFFFAFPEGQQSKLGAVFQEVLARHFRWHLVGSCYNGNRRVTFNIVVHNLF